MRSVNGHKRSFPDAFQLSIDHMHVVRKSFAKHKCAQRIRLDRASAATPRSEPFVGRARPRRVACAVKQISLLNPAQRSVLLVARRSWCPFQPAIVAADGQCAPCWAHSGHIQDKPPPQLTGAALPIITASRLAYTIILPAQPRWAPAPLHPTPTGCASSRSPSPPRSRYTRSVPAA